MEIFEFYKTIRLSSSKEIYEAFPRLNNIYNSIPETIGCLDNISKKGGCNGWCCCLPETRIFTEKGLLPIKNLKEGDRVYTKSGQFRKITNVMSRNINEDIVVIKSCYGREMKLTKDHLVLVDSFKRKNREKPNNPVWVRADELIPKNGKDNLGHYLIFPKYILKNIQSNEIRISDFLKDIFVEDEKCFASYRKRGKNISNVIKLNYDFCWIIGLYLAEGSCGSASVEFHISSEEIELFEKIKSFSNSLNLNFSSRVTSGKSFTVRIFSKVLKRFFESICGKGCENKKIDDKLFSLIIKNTDLRNGLHDGYYAGDGTKKLSNKMRYSIITTSNELYYQIMMLNWINDEIPISYKKENFKKKNVYILSISDGKYKDYVETELDFRVPIRDLLYQKYNGIVYDIEVEKDHSFYTECGEIHNCKIQTPQLLYSEFLLIWKFVSDNWGDDQICDLFERCMLNAIDTIPSKGCVFHDKKTNQCMIHHVRPYACRIYGITPPEEFNPRYERLKEEYKTIVGAIIRPQCNLISAVDGSEVTTEQTSKWWEGIKKAEKILGIPEELITDDMGGSYRTPYDHILLYNMPDNVLNAITGIKMYTNYDDKVNAVKEIMSSIRNFYGITKK
jgi:intein/homing endonuclease